MPARLVAALVSLATAGLLYTSAEQVQNQPAAELRVSVVDDSGGAVAGAHVFLSGITVAFHRVTDSDAGGRAVFDRVPPGTYTVSAEKSGFVSRAFGQRGDESAIPIALVDRDAFTARLELPRAGSITGTIVDENGSPARASVRAIRNAPPSAQRLTTVAATRTAQDGTYRIDDLLPGAYIVSARGADPEPPASTTTGRASVYVPVFFHHTTTASAATPVIVRPAEATPAIDLQLQRAGRARLEGVVLDEDGQPATSRPVVLVRADDDGVGPLTVRTTQTGEFSSTLLPGAYTVIVDGDAMEVIAAADTVTKITLALQRRVRLSGRLRFVGSQPPPVAVGSLGAELVPRTGAPVGVRPVVPLRVESAETLNIGADVPPGEYLLRLGSTFGAWVLESAALDDHEVVDGLLRVAPGAAVTGLVLTLAAPPTELSGSVVDRGGAPVYETRILVFPADREYWRPGSRRVRWLQPDTKGRFTVRGLPPGQYMLAAIAQSQIDWDEALLEAASKGAVSVVLNRGVTTVQNVMIAR